MLAPVASPCPVWTTGTAPPGVRRAMVADGLLVEVLPGVWLPADLSADTFSRAAALAAHLSGPDGTGRARGSTRGAVPTGAVVALAAAAWLHGCPTPPRRVDLLVPRGTGPRGGGGGAVRLRRVVAPGRGACRVGSLVVTGPARTGEDLWASPDPDDRAALGWAVRARLGRGAQVPACSSRRPVAR